MKIGDIVKYTREYLDTISEFPHEDFEHEMIVLDIKALSEVVLIKDKEDETEFSKRQINKYWLYTPYKNNYNIKEMKKKLEMEVD